MNVSAEPVRPASVVSVRHGRDDVVILTLNIPGFSWRGGQYLQLHKDGFEPRYYSIANAMTARDTHAEIHVRRARDRGLSAFLVDQASPGMELAVAGPYGDLSLPAVEAGRALLLIAGGLGIAPLKALAEDALQNSARPPVTLAWGTNFTQDQYLKDYFDRLCTENENFRFISVTGEFVSHAVGNLLDDFAGYEIFISGPPDMVIATKSLLLNRQVAAHRIHHDPLPPGIPNKEQNS